MSGSGQNLSAENAPAADLRVGIDPRSGVAADVDQMRGPVEIRIDARVVPKSLPFGLLPTITRQVDVRRRPDTSGHRSRTWCRRARG